MVLLQIENWRVESVIAADMAIAGIELIATVVQQGLYMYEIDMTGLTQYLYSYDRSAQYLYRYDRPCSVLV